MNGFIWGAYGRRAGEAEREAVRARSKAETVEWGVREVAERMDRLTLVCMAMWSLLEERAGLTEEDLMERVKEIDLRDGVPDGKVSKTVAQCLKCGRVMSPRHNRCLYCGAQKLQQSAFDAL